MPASRTNIREIARRASVSIATVSRVLNNSPFVRKDTRERVQGIMKKLHFQPNLLAQSLSRSQSLVVGVFTHPEPDMKAHYFVEVLQGINQAFLAHPHTIAINPDNYDELKGVLILAPSHRNPLLAKVVQRQIPAVLINASSPRFSSVDIDNVSAAREAVSHLIQLGHRRIGAINGKLDVANGRDRLEGYRKALEDQGLSVMKEWIVDGGFDQGKGYRAMKTLLELDDRPTAVFAANDHMAAGAMKAAQDAGLRIPQDVAIAGFDDIDLAPYMSPPLTTVRQPLRQMGYEAGRMLVDLLSGQTSNGAQRHLLLEGKLVIRQSCGAYANPFPRTAMVNADVRH